MGIYAETDAVIYCDSDKTAEKVKKYLVKMNEDSLDGNRYGTDFVVDDSALRFVENSPRIQNLEYRCEKIREKVRKIKGVKSIECPFMTEADGIYYDNDNDLPVIDVKDYDK